MQISNIIRSKEFLLTIIIATSAFIYFPYFVTSPDPFPKIESWLIDTTVVIASFAVLVSVYTLTRREGLKFVRRAKAWPYGLVVLASSWFMIIVGLVYSRDADAFKFVTNAFILPGDAAIYAILVFYLTSTAARSFKVKNLESLVLMIGAITVLLQQAPLGEYLFPFMGPVGLWMVNDLSMAASRVFTITATLAAIVLAVRLLAGKEMTLVGLVSKGEKK